MCRGTPLAQAAAAITLGLAGAAAADSSLEAGWGHNVVLTPSGQVWAWGENDSGALGNGTTTNSTIPVRSGSLANMVAVAAGDSFSVALRGNGTVFTWGTQIGLGVGTAPATCLIPNSFALDPVYDPCAKSPVQVPGITTAVAVAAGSGHVLVVLSDRTVRAWGRNSAGQLGNGSTTQSLTPVAVPQLANVAAVAAGDDFSLALLANGTVMAWGNHTHGELGIGTASPGTCSITDPYASTPPGAALPCARSPVQVPGLANIVAIAAGGRHALALSASGTVYAWGSNRYGQLGDGTRDERRSPIAVTGMGTVSEIDAGFGFSLARNSGGTVWVWGLNYAGQLGITSADNCPKLTANYPCTLRPAQAAGFFGAPTIVGGGVHTVAVLANGNIVAVGGNNAGQLGYGTTVGGLVSFSHVDPHGPRPAGAAGSGTSLGTPSTAAGLNLNTVEGGLRFAAQAVGTTSAALEVTFTNQEEFAIAVLSVAASGNFGQTNNCPASLGSYVSCSISVRFSPTGPGERTGALTVTTNLPDAAAITLALSGTGTGTAPAAANYSDIWWNPNESGWGLTLADHETQLFAVWYTYESSGKPVWFTIPGGTFTANRRFFAGDVYSTTGPCYSAPTFNPSLVAATRRGTASFDFAPPDLPAGWARFTGSIGSTTWSKAIQRQPFGNAAPNWGTDYTDIWWTSTESGWGLTLAQHGNNVFGALYTYDCDASPLFVVMPGVNFSGSTSFTGALYTTRSSGSWYGSATFNPAHITASNVGTATVTFTGRTATFSATINGSTRVRTIVQQPFGNRAPGTP
jgi:alpha-tubulin suppressor-like RCC1 family protein